MEMQDYPIVGSFNSQNILQIDAERTVNLFEYIDRDGKKPKSLISTAGLTNTGVSFSGAANGHRASYIFKDKSYIVVGSNVYVWDGTLSPSLLGSFSNTFEGYVGITANTFQIIFVDGSEGYIYDTNASTFTKITDTSFPTKPIDVCYLDGFFVVANGDTNQFQLSTFNQGMVWGPAEDVFSASASTDLLTLTSTANYSTGVPVTFVPPSTGDSFTSAASTDLLTISSTTNYPTGVPVRVSGASLSSPLVAGTTYYVINISPTTIKLATTYANSLVPTPINLTTDGSGTILGQLPDPLVIDTTYYTIHISTTTLKVALTYDDAIAGTAIDLLSNGSPNNQILSEGQLQLAEVTSQPGTIMACRTLHRRIFFFSQNFTEVWENSGTGTNLPFRRNNSLLMEIGTPSRASVALGFDKLFFLSQDQDGLSSVIEVEGTQGRPISSRAIDFTFAQYAAIQKITVNDPSAILIKQNGLIFYRLNFTLANHTFVYNDSLSQENDFLWHEEEVLNGDRHPAQTHMYFKGINYYGNYNNQTLYIVDSNNATNDGQTIRRMRIGKPIVDPTYKRLRIDRYHLDLMQGQVDNIPQNIAPTVFLSYSKDGGQTYGSKLTSSMGKIGKRTVRTVWRKLGVVPRGQGFVPKIEFFNKIPFIILGAAWAFEVLPE